MKARNLLEWALALGLAAALFFMVGLPKIIGPSPNPIFAIIAGRSGVSLFEPMARYATGVAEIVAAILLAAPYTRPFGAALAGGVICGAIAFHVSPWLGVHVPNLTMVSQELKAGKTIAQIDAMNLPNDHGALFSTALIFLVAAVAVLVMSGRRHRSYRRRLFSFV